MKGNFMASDLWLAKSARMRAVQSLWPEWIVSETYLPSSRQLPLKRCIIFLLKFLCTKINLLLQMATCFASSSGIKVTVEQAKCLQANAFIQSSLFQEFAYNASTPAAFRLNLNALIVSTAASWA